MPNPNDLEQLQSLLDTAEEALFKMTEEGLTAEERVQAASDEQLAQGILASQLKAHRKRKLEAAKLAMRAAKEAQAGSIAILPIDPAARRRLYNRIVANDPGSIPDRLTVGFRDGVEVTDSEVDSILEALAILGRLDIDGKE